MQAGMRDGGRFASAWALSVVAHGALLAVGALLVASSMSARASEIASGSALPRPPEPVFEVELPVFLDDGTGLISAPEEPRRAPRGGGEARPRPDTGASGRSGAESVDAPAVNLADRDDGALLSAEVRSRLDRSQVQRIQSAKERASLEDWRASREPMELTFVANGRRGTRPERRPQAAFDPSSGARDRGAPLARGGQLGSPPLPPGADVSPRATGGSVEGSSRSGAGVGVRDGAPGHDHRLSAEVARARPMVAEGAPSVPANTKAKPKDTLDSEQEVSTPDQSIVHASTAGGEVGRGPGGEHGGDREPTGSGGLSGSGSTAKALGTGVGAGTDVNPGDRRRLLYMRQVMAKISPLWADAFPKWAILEGRQGTVIITFVIAADGRVAGAGVTRPSGIPEFDENCRRAVLRAAPFPPLPPELGTSFRWAMPFDAKNPVVRPGG